MTLPTVLVTRPEAAGRELASALERAGVPALWLPAFELGPAPDAAAVDATLAALSQFDLAIFVSPAAVLAAARHLRAHWPATTAIGVVGATTRAAVEEHIPAAAQARIIGPRADEGAGTAGSESGSASAAAPSSTAPSFAAASSAAASSTAASSTAASSTAASSAAASPAAASPAAASSAAADSEAAGSAAANSELSGSEALWRALQDADLHVRNALLLRAAHGREWLVERLRATGARVTPLAVYARVAAQWDAPLRQRLQAVLRQGMAPALLVSSSEAIDAVRQQLDAVPGAWDWAQRGCALATHPRIEARLREQGFARVVVCRPDVAAIRAALTGP